MLAKLGIVLPTSFYAATRLRLLRDVGCDLFPSGRSRRQRSLLGRAVVAMPLVAVLLVFTIFDLVRTPVGTDLVGGVQGRCLLPLRTEAPPG